MRIHGKDIDPLTGVVTTYGSEDGQMIVKTEQDVAPHMEYSTALRNAPEYAKRGIRDNLQHVAHIPNAVLMKMKTEDGFDAFNANPRELFAHMRKNRHKYGYLFTTAGKV